MSIPPAQIQRLEDYCQLLWAANQRLNLTRHLDYETFVIRDVIDSLALAEQLSPDLSVLDVGTGGGVPGIPLAILRPDLQISLCDSSGKKCEAVAEIVQQLALSLPVYQDRVENVVQIAKFDAIVARAVGPLWKILKWMEPHWNEFGCLVLIKGPKWTEERLEARHKGFLKPLEIRRLSSYTTPGHHGENVILGIMTKVEANSVKR